MRVWRVKVYDFARYIYDFARQLYDFARQLYENARYKYVILQKTTIIIYLKFEIY